MSLPFILFLIFSIFRSTFCENCSEALLENFQKTFNLSDKCGDCAILKPESYFDNGNWSGICSGNRYLMFPEWKCGSSSEPFALVSQNTCEILDENNFDIDDDCFGKFIDEKCGNLTRSKLENDDYKKFWKRSSQDKKGEKGDFESEPNGSLGKNSLFVLNERFDTNKFRQRTSTTELTTIVSTSENLIRTKRTSTESTSTKQTTETETTVTEETDETGETEETEETDETDETEETEETKRTEQTVTEETETMETEETKATKSTSTEKTEYITTRKQTTTPASTSKTTIKTTKTLLSTNLPLPTLEPSEELCEPNEYFFENHCYFLKSYDTVKDGGHSVRGKSNFGTPKNPMSICVTHHPLALGLAVETKEENEFIIKTLKKFYFLNWTIILTSGVRSGGVGVWSGWNQEINHTVINIGKTDLSPKYYTIDPCKGYWHLWNGDTSNRKLFLICERPYNPKQIIQKLYMQCLRMYRNSHCYNKEKHARYCCAKDGNGDLWFACPNETLYKPYPDNIHCFWECKGDGYFFPVRPVCKGNITCSATHNNIAYTAPITTYAISSCPKNSTGYSTWYCNSNRTFIGLPDYGLCCDNPTICKDTDIFLNMWTGCSSKKIVKKTTCPPGSAVNEAYVEWYCHSNGSFNGSTPNYSNCSIPDASGCSKKDGYGIQWVAELGTTVYKDCPPSFTGQCSWKCKKTGRFDSPEPDCTWCRAKWMDNIAEKIKNNSHHEEVITVMEEYTEKEDLRVGYKHVLNLTSQCVSLYKKQNVEGGQTCHYKFLKGYSKIFKNLAGSTTLWSSFSESSRKEFADDVINITQDATFANLEAGHGPPEPYNATFAYLKTDGFDFFVAYNPSIKGCKFPLENPSESEWHVEIKEVNESNSNFAAMGLVMNYSLSSLMFPQGEETGDKEINAPALTFAVAFSRDGKAVVDQNVSVSVSFKHINRTRYPNFVEIRRRLHRGERPTGVFNSTVCHYYRDSGWNTDGCTVTYTSKDRTDCICTHLSTIGLLMTIHKYVPDTTLEIISIVSSGVTILSLILTLLVFFFFDTAKNDRVLIGKNLCICLLVGHVMLITVIDKRFFYIPDEYCKIYAAALHYVFMAAFAWMFVEGCHLYRMLVLVFDSDIEYRYVYLLIGYGVPFVVVGATYLIGFAFQEQPYGQDELCWLKYPNYIWAFIGPVIVITSINFYILIIAMKLAISSRTRTEHSNLTSFKLWLKGWFTLSSLLGITWLFGFALVSYDKFLLYGFVLFNGLQGFFIFLFRCVLNEQYNEVFLKRIRLFSSSFNSKYKKEDTVKSETKVIVISASKSLSSCEIGTKVSDSEVLGRFLEGKRKSKPDVENPEVDINVEVTLKPAVSVAYLRNRMIAQNFAARRSKATWMNESDNIRYKP